jgi:hypothetical protein
MKLTAEDYRRHYRELSDEEFLAIDRDDLVDVARRCYDAELAHRQLEPTGLETDAEEAPDEEAPRVADISDGKMVQVAVLTSPEMAQYAQKMLREADIPVSLAAAPETPGRISGNICVLVAASCVEPARDLLAGVLGGSNTALVREWLEHEWTPDGMDIAEFHVAVEDLFAEENKVAARMTVTGVNPRTGGDVRMEGLAIVHVADGSIGETWIKLDH